MNSRQFQSGFSPLTIFAPVYANSAIENLIIDVLNRYQTIFGTTSPSEIAVCYKVFVGFFRLVANDAHNCNAVHDMAAGYSLHGR